MSSNHDVIGLEEFRRQFAGKLVGVRDKESKGSYLLEQAELQLIGGRVFLVGTEVGNNWAKGLRFTITWEEVRSMFLCDCVEEYERRMRTFRTQHGSKWSWWKIFLRKG